MDPQRPPSTSSLENWYRRELEHKRQVAFNEAEKRRLIERRMLGVSDLLIRLRVYEVLEMARTYMEELQDKKPNRFSEAGISSIEGTQERAIGFAFPSQSYYWIDGVCETEESGEYWWLLTYHAETDILLVGGARKPASEWTPREVEAAIATELTVCIEREREATRRSSSYRQPSIYPR